MTFLLWVAGAPALEFYGKAAALECRLVALAVMAKYHAAAVCMMAVGA